jgi:hypothetical protein
MLTVVQQDGTLGRCICVSPSFLSERAVASRASGGARLGGAGIPRSSPSSPSSVLASAEEVRPNRERETMIERLRQERGRRRSAAAHDARGVILLTIFKEGEYGS